MAYTELGPPPVLAPWLACTWERATDDGPPVRVLPDGCIDIVWIEGRLTQVVGPNTTAFAVSLPPGTRVAGARLLPGAGPSLLGVAAQSLRDARIAVDEVWGDDGRRLAATLDDSSDPAAAIASWLADRAARAAVARSTPAGGGHGARPAGCRDRPSRRRARPQRAPAPPAGLGGGRLRAQAPGPGPPPPARPRRRPGRRGSRAGGARRRLRRPGPFHQRLPRARRGFADGDPRQVPAGRGCPIPARRPTPRLG